MERTLYLHVRTAKTLDSGIERFWARLDRKSAQTQQADPGSHFFVSSKSIGRSRHSIFVAHQRANLQTPQHQHSTLICTKSQSLNLPLFYCEPKHGRGRVLAPHHKPHQSRQRIHWHIIINHQIITHGEMVVFRGCKGWIFLRCPLQCSPRREI